MARSASDVENLSVAKVLTKVCPRFFENRHLLDATEIFRKLNIHKKVYFPSLHEKWHY